jgi:hypothetical protein
MRRLSGFVMVAALALAGGACGGGGERQDADEPSGEYKLEVVDAKFPPEQSIAERSALTLQIRNADTKAAPNVAVTIETQPEQAGGAPGSFAQNRDDEGLADPSRPVWILDRGPEGGETAYTNTWALGRLEPGQSKTFEWRVTAVKAGDFQVGYTVAPGLDGKARLAAGTEARGSFLVTVDDQPADARIAEDGETVVREDPDSE